jgi:hypothetical protein
MTNTSRNDEQTAQLHFRLLQQNGLAALLVGFVGGFVLVAAILGGISASPLPLFLKVAVPGTVRGWLGFHLGMLLNGMMALILAAVFQTRRAPPRRSAVIAWGIVIAIWGNCAFYLFTMFAPNRGLTAEGNAFGSASLAGYLAFFPALAGAMSVILSVWLMLRSPLRRQNTEAGPAAQR